MTLETLGNDILYLSIAGLAMGFWHSIKYLKHCCILYTVLLGFMLFTQVSYVILTMYLIEDETLMLLSDMSYDLAFLLTPLALMLCKVMEKKKNEKLKQYT